MSAIATVIHRDGRPVDRQLLASVNACVRHRCPDGAWVWGDGPVGMAQADLATLPEDEPGVPVFSGSLRIAASCRIDNHDEIRAMLPSGCYPRIRTDSGLILAAYQAWGEACVDRLIGDFAFVIWDSARRKVFAARDISGVRPLYYYCDEKTLFIASDRTQILQDPDVPCEVDEEQVIEYLTPTHQSARGWNQGLFRGFHALPVGSILQQEEGGQIRVRPYWEWQEREPGNQTPDQVLDEYLHHLREAVRCRLRSRSPVGMELSGGLDSSAVACLAAQMSDDHPSELHTFSGVFDETMEADERPRIQAVLDRYPQLSPHFLIADRQFAPQCLYPDWDPRHIMGPFDIWMPPAAHQLYDMAEQAGCRTMLTGQSGDILNFGGYRIHYDLLRRRRFRDLLRLFRIDRRRYGRWALRAQLGFGLFPLLAPMPLLNAVLIAKERRKGARKEVPSYIPDTLRARILEMDEAIRIQRIEQNRVRCPVVRNTVNSMFPPKLGFSLQYAQPIETRHPYMDRRLIEMVLSMPQDMRWNHEEADPSRAIRHHHRQALAGILPDEVRLNNRKAAFTKVVTQNFTPAVVRQWLMDSPAVHIFERGYVNPDQFMEVVDKFEDPTAGYLSGMICLEGWLRAMTPGGKMHRLIAAPRMMEEDRSVRAMPVSSLSSRPHPKGGSMKLTSFERSILWKPIPLQD